MTWQEVFENIKSVLALDEAETQDTQDEEDAF